MQKHEYDWTRETAWMRPIIDRPDVDLNKLKIRVDRDEDRAFMDPGVRTKADAEVVFRNIEDRLVEFINEAEIVVGCVAWLTNYNILSALAKKRVALIVQKEDFLRPDKMSKEMLRRLYRELGSQESIERYAFRHVLNECSVCCSPEIDPVRCVGNHNRERNPSFPRMHNKFIISAKMAKIETGYGGYYEKIEPQAVWTGSFNFSYNAGRSLENAVILRDETIADAYLKEFEQIAAISERLNWTEDWVAPEWRIGT